MRFLLPLILFASCATPKPQLTLAHVTDAFRSLPLEQTIVYDERTDPNKLLGRPNGYIAKMNFNDARVENKAIEKCSIEVFKNEADAKARKDYIEAVDKAFPLGGTYHYLHRNVLVRIDLALPPEDAESYKRALESLN